MTFQILQYLRHILTAQSTSAISDPALKELANSLLARSGAVEGEEIESFRRELSRSEVVIELIDLGAGYGGRQNPKVAKKVKEVVRSSARGRGEGELLLRLVRAKAPAQMLELGTNLGFSTLYLAKALPNSQLITIEGSPALSGLAQAHFQRFKVHPTQFTGDFSQVLHNEIDWTSFHPGLVFLDGNHRYQPTVEYADFLIPRMAANGILVLDDIYWSPGMKKAWEEIKSRPEIGLSLDLYHLGICFLQENTPKQEIKLRFMP
ncbi:MAG: class I SAM-dependent methyltransferase [Bacteroidia bacterium]|nr:class I SAM-dependent methyltransferase [Bacteroidia bacterium]